MGALVLCIVLLPLTVAPFPSLCAEYYYVGTSSQNAGTFLTLWKKIFKAILVRDRLEHKNVRSAHSAKLKRAGSTTGHVSGGREAAKEPAQPLTPRAAALLRAEPSVHRGSRIGQLAAIFMPNYEDYASLIAGALDIPLEVRGRTATADRTAFPLFLALPGPSHLLAPLSSMHLRSPFLQRRTFPSHPLRRTTPIRRCKNSRRRSTG